MPAFPSGMAPIGVSHAANGYGIGILALAYRAMARYKQWARATGP
ncbi:hypothetical protein J2848_000662 [Azospirillum lipoferum]|nr:hypothetical protein [Azospirillum lipoferum]